MKKIKRLSALLLCPALAASLLTGCGGSPAENAAPDAGGAAAEPAAQTSTKSITLCLSARDEWLSTLASAAISAGSELGYEINVQDCQNDTNKQIQYVETARNAGDEIMLVNLVDFSLAQEVLDAAGDMKIVFVNRRPTDDALLDENHIYVGSDEAEAGMQQGQYLAAYFKAQGKTEVKYLLLSGDLGMPSTIKRSEYAIKGMEEGGLTVSEATAPLVCKWDRATTIDKLSPILAQGLAYDCIIANNDAMALGAVEALKAAGIDPSTVPIVGIDATQDGRNAVKNGELAMTSFQNAQGQGEGSVKAAVNLLSGKALNEGSSFDLDPSCAFAMYIPFETVTIDNVADYD